jgi:hypothetical protein
MTVAASFLDFANSAPDTPTLTFGKHRGAPLSEIETNYLEWVKTADRITPDMLAAIECELATRQTKVRVQDRWRVPTGVPKEVTDIARLLVECGTAELRAALGQDFRVDAAAELLKAALGAIELEADPGTLPPF